MISKVRKKIYKKNIRIFLFSIDQENRQVRRKKSIRKRRKRLKQGNRN